MEKKLKKQNRICKRREFLKIGKINNKIHLSNFIVLYSKNKELNSRIGITVTKKVGNSPTRNKIKRYVRECFRKNKIPGYDIIFVAKPKKEFTYQSTLEDYQKMCRIFEKLVDKTRSV